MSNDMVNQLILGIGAMAEIWTVTFKSFINQGLTEPEAMEHTKALMSVILENTMSSDSNGGKK